jgi:RsiW-degrading membrane proteinase PrsW (M82 family)
VIDFLVRLSVGIVPVLIFLGALVYLDSYKLVRLRWILATIGFGGLVAGLCYAVNSTLIASLPLGPALYSRYVSPWIEESAKAALVLYLIRSNRVGFLVDAAICGFAVGTGFAVLENITYLNLLPNLSITGWIIRGCGTAVMHGGASAIFGIATKALSERGFSPWVAGFPGIATAFAIHSVFNHFFLTPVLSALGMILGLPPLLFAVFNRSEASLRSWLEVGFDGDTELLELIHSGELSGSRIGKYLHSLKERFQGEVLADMLCYLRLNLELALSAKGHLMMRESGFKVEVSEETREKLQELQYLEKSIGLTGKLAMDPFLRTSGKELWQLTLIGK